jgi:hypothetical protein
MGRASARKKEPTSLAVVPASPVKLDFGCGPHKRDGGFLGVDAHPFLGVDIVHDLTVAPYPWADNSVSEAHASHFLEHLTPWQRVLFYNELYRILVPGGSCQIIVPHWASCRAYGDPTHQWPAVSEFSMYYINRDWRLQNAPHCDVSVVPQGFNCHFEATWGYSMRQDLLVRNQEFQQFALANYKEAAQDMIATVKAIK